MALSDQLSALSIRAKQLEDRATAAKTKAKADLEQDVKAASASAQAQADELRNSAVQAGEEASAWMRSVGSSWNDHIDALQKKHEAKRAARDLKSAQRYADEAADDATYAVSYAYGAIEEAEYAVLNATLARMDAEELAKS
jgi:hypothetical protein